jgi:hypothetical protein
MNIAFWVEAPLIKLRVLFLLKWLTALPAVQSLIPLHACILNNYESDVLSVITPEVIEPCSCLDQNLRVPPISISELRLHLDTNTLLPKFNILNSLFVLNLGCLHPLASMRSG